MDRLLYVLLLLIAFSAPFSIAISQTALALATLVGIVRLGRRERPPRLGIEVWVLLLVAWTLLVIPFSQNPSQSLVHAKRWLILPALWLFPWGAGNEQRRRGVLLALMAGGIAVSLYGLWQFASVGGRVFMTTNPMTGAALLMAPALALSAAMLVPENRAFRPWGFAALGLLICLIMLTSTRSVWLGIVGALIALLALERPRLLPAFFLLLALGFSLAPSTYQQRLFSLFGANVTMHASNYHRLQLWQTGWDLMRDHPLTGTGDRDLKDATSHLTMNGDPLPPRGHLHSNPVMFGAIWGLPGLILALALHFAMLRRLLAIRRGWARRSERAPPLASSWVLGATAFWVGLFVAGLFEWYFGDAEVMLVFYSVMGLGLGGGVSAPKEGSA